VKTEIHSFQVVTHSLDSRFRGNDDFLPDHHPYMKEKEAKKMADVKREFGIVGLSRMGGSLALQALQKDMRAVGLKRKSA